MPQNTVESFRSRVSPANPVTGCREWTGGKNPDGYGRLSFKGRRVMAHVLAYELTYGSVPAGLELDHTCRNRACVNPAHLEPVTHRENLLRSPLTLPSINLRKTHCPAGHPYSVPNTYYRAKGDRLCRECTLVAARAYRARRAAQARRAELTCAA